MAQADMQGKVCLVTGSSSGLGKATAKRLAQLKATVTWGAVTRNAAKLPLLPCLWRLQGVQSALHL
jgi:NAD(P)-dependent dehydrogenase (short-subunit alcohol dehydrogenase family)